MRTKILIMMLCAVQLVSAQLGDQLLEKQISQSNNEYQPEKMRVFGKCEGACFSDAIFNPTINSTNFKVSHGSPTFSTNSVWMWSYKGSSSIRGEGVFTGFKFVKGRTYCIEADIELTRSTTDSINPAATFNFDATNTVTAGGTSSGGGTLPTITPRQSLISGNYSTGTYPFNSTFKIRKTVTINDNYSQLWIYPKNPGKPHPQLNMRVSNIVIKEVIDCPCQIKGAIKYKVGPNCQFQFAGNATAGSSTTITGYLWNFGDGTTSTQQNPTHAYTQQGSYVVTLTVLGINKEGECCTQVFKTKVRVKGECYQECEINASFKVIRTGSWFWRSYNFMNTSSSNAFTTIMGYAWYVDGVLVSTNKDFVNYGGRGKRVCLKVYGIDKKGNCCQEEYCYTLRK